MDFLTDPQNAHLFEQAEAAVEEAKNLRSQKKKRTSTKRRQNQPSGKAANKKKKEPNLVSYEL